MIAYIKNFFVSQKTEPLSHTLVKREFRMQLGERMRKDCIVILSDPYYTPISESHINEIYERAGLRNKKYIPDLFDCDNYAMAMTVSVAEHARRSRKTRYQYAFGIVYGDIPTLHAINWFITPEEKVMFMEPQSGEIFHPKGNNIVFLYT